MGINILSETAKHRVKIFTDLDGKKIPFKFENTIFESLNKKGLSVSLISSVLEYCTSYLRSNKWNVCKDNISENKKINIFDDAVNFYLSLLFKFKNYLKILGFNQSLSENKNTEIKSIEPINATQSKPLNATNKKTKEATEPVSTTSINTHPVTATSYKKIDLKKGLNSILQQQTGYSDTAKNDPQKKRITVPKEHAGKVKPLLKIEQQNMQFTTYRRGDSCFKKVSIGAGVMPKKDLPESYIVGVKCDKTKLTKAYDTAMNKWLDKK